MLNIEKLLFICFFIISLVACGGASDGDKDKEKDKDDPTVNKVPVANAMVTPSIVIKGDTATFDGSKSKDIDGNITSYQWKEGTTLLASQVTFTQSDFSLGVHTITLTVTDNSGATNSADTQLTVNRGHRIKKTGQSTSYDKNGDVDNNLKDDGFYQKGVAQNYSRNSTNNIVTDLVTGLDWQDDEDAKTIRKPWLLEANFDLCEASDFAVAACLDTAGDTAATYCNNLSLGGHSNWRVPSARELESIIDYGRYPSVDTNIFKNVTQSFYWTSTTRKESTKHASAWTVSFEEGNLHNGNKSSGHSVRCVRYSN